MNKGRRLSVRPAAIGITTPRQQQFSLRQLAPSPLAATIFACPTKAAIPPITPASGSHARRQISIGDPGQLGEIVGQDGIKYRQRQSLETGDFGIPLPVGEPGRANLHELAIFPIAAPNSAPESPPRQYIPDRICRSRPPCPTLRDGGVYPRLARAVAGVVMRQPRDIFYLGRRFPEAGPALARQSHMDDANSVSLLCPGRRRRDGVSCG